MLGIDDILVDGGVSIRDCLERLDGTGRRILLLIDEQGRLLRTITDGDLRRLLLGGCRLDDPLGTAEHDGPVIVSPGTTLVECRRIMDRHGIDQLPVIDDAGRPVGMHHRAHLDRPVLLSPPHLGSTEALYVQEAIDSNWIAPAGPDLEAFEEELACMVGAGHAVALSSGTAAIHLGLRLLGVRNGDRVLCPSMTFVASANPILYLGAEPIFLDSDPMSWTVSTNAMARALEESKAEGRLPAAMITVGLYGQSPDMEQICRICEEHDIPVLEDAAESLGATCGGRSSGTIGRVGVYSFNGNKIITTSGGGMLVSDDGELVEEARHLATQGREPKPWYEHEVCAYNYRMSNILAAIGRAQLEKLGSRVAIRRAIFDRYESELRTDAPIDWMEEAPWGTSTRWLSAGLLRADRISMTNMQLVQLLSEHNIEARPAWKPMHRQPLFEGCQYFTHEPGRSVCDELFNRGICLPSSSNMSNEQQDRVIETIRWVCRSTSRLRA